VIEPLKKKAIGFQPSAFSKSRAVLLRADGRGLSCLQWPNGSMAQWLNPVTASGDADHRLPV